MVRLMEPLWVRFAQRSVVAVLLSIVVVACSSDPSPTIEEGTPDLSAATTVESPNSSVGPTETDFTPPRQSDAVQVFGATFYYPAADAFGVATTTRLAGFSELDAQMTEYPDSLLELLDCVDIGDYRSRYVLEWHPSENVVHPVVVTLGVGVTEAPMLGQAFVVELASAGQFVLIDSEPRILQIGGEVGSPPLFTGAECGLFVDQGIVASPDSVVFTTDLQIPATDAPLGTLQHYAASTAPGASALREFLLAAGADAPIPDTIWFLESEDVRDISIRQSGTCTEVQSYMDETSELARLVLRQARGCEPWQEEPIASFDSQTWDVALYGNAADPMAAAPLVQSLPVHAAQQVEGSAAYDAELDFIAKAESEGFAYYGPLAWPGYGVIYLIASKGDLEGEVEVAAFVDREEKNFGGFGSPIQPGVCVGRAQYGDINAGYDIAYFDNPAIDQLEKMRNGEWVPLPVLDFGDVGIALVSGEQPQPNGIEPTTAIVRGLDSDGQPVSC